MAYQLKASGIAANCTMCMAVDPDTSTIKDFASSGVTTDLTVGGNVTISSQTWDGNTRYYWRPGSGTADADFVKFGTTKPHWEFNTTDLERTIVFIGEVAGLTAIAFGKDSSNYFASRSIGAGGNTYPQWYGLGHTTQQNGGLSPLASTNKAIFGFSAKHGSGSGYMTAYAALHDASAMTVVSGLTAPTSTSGSMVFDLTYINRRNDSTTHQQDKTHAILIFDAALSESQWDSLRDDWFGTLLEAAGGGGGGAEAAARNYYAQLRSN